ncbi:hypothetical protein Dvina_45040 [Dactylosporangium vinaceum]|uniref:DUF2637 domain-containing protein n=1 Tax=Dactylosporangium vinaceum TaxID=53362 RepID=A0ABV5MIN9_9ACTN|nr:hypothetical protein [Dactylosporangium vinaceum]UAB95142.1 hypothetical protein Dvina_45040 [Dactylosporangium vinaceum]
MATSTSGTGRGWAYTGAILGGAISIAANIAHSFIQPTSAPDTWRPEPGAVISAMAWPVVLFVAVEILARTPWPDKLGYHLLRWIGLPPVAFVAALVSYRHLSGLLGHYGEETLVQRLGPIAIDGLMLMATGAIIATRHPNPPADRITPADTTTTTTTTTASAPLATAASVPSPTAAPAQPVVAADRVPVAATPDPGSAAGADHSPAEPSPAESVQAPDTASTEQADSTQHRHETVPTAPESAQAASAHDFSVTAADAAQSLKLPVPAALLTRARHITAAHLEATNVPITPGQLAARLRVDTGTAKQVIALLDLDPNRLRHPAMTANGTSMDRTA